MCLGVPGQILEMVDESTACVDVAGNMMEISTRLTPMVGPGDWVLIHAGFAMEVIDEAIANETMSYLDEMQRYADIPPREWFSTHSEEGTPIKI